MKKEDRIKWINEGASRILLMDFNELADFEFIEQLHICLTFIKNTKSTNLLLIFDVTSAKVYGDALVEAKKFAKDIQPFRKKSAMLGISGVKQVLLNSILRFSGSSDKVRICSNIDDAKKWLLNI